MTYELRKKHLFERHEALLAMKNEPEEWGNGIYERYQHPILTAEHTPLEWRYDFSEKDNPYLMQRIMMNAVLDGDAHKILFRQGMRRHGILILLQPHQKTAVLLNIMGKLFEQLILQSVLIALVIRFHQAQTGHVHVQRHFLLDAVISGAEGFDFSIGKRRFVHVLTGAHRGF